jgi:PAS domain S-box-containing protein
MRLATRSRIDLGFAIALVVVLGVSALTFRSLGRADADERAVAESQQRLLAVEGVVSTLKDAETGQRGYLLTRQPRFLEPYRAATAGIEDALARLDAYPEARSYAPGLRRLAMGKLAILDETVRLGERGDFERATAIVGSGRGKEAMDRIRAVAAEVAYAEERALARRRAAAGASAGRTRAVVGLGTALAFLLVGVARFATQRSVGAQERAQRELGRSERSLRRLYEITSTAGGTGDFGPLLALGCEHFGLSTGLLSRVCGDRWEVLAIHPPDGALRAGASFPLEDVYCSVTLHSAEPVSFEHAGQSQWSEHRCYTATGMEAYLGAPVRVRGEQAGTLCFLDRAPRAEPFTERDRAFLRILAQWVGGELERREAAEALGAREERYRSLVESASDLIYTTDREGRFTYVNPPFTATLGFGEAELLGRPALDLVREDQRRVVGRFYREQVEEGRATSYLRIPVVTRDGREVWLGQNWVLLRERGEVVGAQAVARDITRQYETERMKDEFLSVVSHELRTPLTAIRGSLGLLASGKMGTLQERGQRMLEIAARNTDRLVRLINDLLDLEKMASGKETLERRDVDAADLVQQAAEVMRPMAAQNGVELVAAGAPAPLWADPDRVLQVLVNLLSNAIKFSPQGGAVRLEAAREGGEVRFRVRDEGRGIPADKLEAVFERFQQVDSSDAREKGGTGLGLPIARKIAEQHGGRLWVESEWGRGSTFFLALPVPHALAATAPEEAPLVLVCDDDGAIAAVARAVLEREGYRVAIAGSGEEALEVTRSCTPAAILLDLRMPGMDGAATLAALRARPETRQVPVLIFSAFSRSEAGAGIADVAGWLQKPTADGDLVDAVERAVGAADAGAHVDVLIVEDDDGIAGVLRELFGARGVSTHRVRTGAEAVEASQRMRFSLLVLDLGLPDTDGFAVIDWMRRHGALSETPVLVYTARDVDDRERERLGAEVLTKGRVSLEAFEERAAELLGRVAGPERAP